MEKPNETSTLPGTRRKNLLQFGRLQPKINLPFLKHLDKPGKLSMSIPRLIAILTIATIVIGALIGWIIDLV